MKCGLIFQFLAVFAAAGQLVAQNSRIAVVDLKEAVQAHPDSKALEAELQTKGGNANSVLTAKNEELAKIGQDGQELTANPLSRGLDGKLLPDVVAKLNDLQKRGNELRRSMLELQAETRAELSGERDAGLVKIGEKIAVIIKKVNAGRFDVVLDKSSTSRSGLPQVLDYSGATDITEEVIAKIQSAEKAPAKL